MPLQSFYTHKFRKIHRVIKKARWALNILNSLNCEIYEQRQPLVRDPSFGGLLSDSLSYMMLSKIKESTLNKLGRVLRLNQGQCVGKKQLLSQKECPGAIHFLKSHRSPSNWKGKSERKWYPRHGELWRWAKVPTGAEKVEDVELSIFLQAVALKLITVFAWT